MSKKCIKSPLAVLASALIMSLTFTHLAVADEQLKAAIEAQERKSESMRDQYRHPYETLTFFGVEPDMTIVELAPSGGWYSEILGPYLAEEGQLVAAHFNLEREDAPSYYASAMAHFKKRISNIDRFGDVEIIPFDPPTLTQLGEPSSADMVLSFRSVHGWKRDNVFTDVLKAAKKVLKPSGIFGIVGHRLPENGDDSEFTGYVKQSWIIEQAETNGFKLVAASEVNANPADSANHENGVWTLPPTLNTDNEETREKNKQIGESDRFTLKFMKK